MTIVNKNSINYLLAIALVIVIAMTKDYLAFIFLGGFVAIITYPLYQFFIKATIGLNYKYIISFFTKGDRNVDPNKSVATLLTLLTATFVVVGLFGLVSFTAGSAVQKSLATNWESGIDAILANKEGGSLLLNNGITKEVISSKVNGGLTSLFKFDVDFNKITNFSSTFVSNVTNFLINFIVFLFSWAVLTSSGKDMLEFTYKFTDLNSVEQDIVNTDVISAVRNVLLGNFVSGLAVATAVSIIGLYFHLPLVLVFALIAFIIGFLPLSPSELAFIPVLIGCYFSSGIIPTIIVAIIAEMFVLALNNLVLPKITAGKENNPLLILVSIFSSITFFGFAGFIIGPVLIYFAMALVKIASSRLTKIKEY